MKILLTLVLLFSSSALASPAQDLFNQAAYFIAVRYNGFSSAETSNFAAQFQADLDEACKDQLPNCPYSSAVPVLQKMMTALGDGHSYYLSPEQYQAQLSQARGLGSSTPRLGIITADAKDSFERLVADVWAGSPAAKAGLKRGDRIVGFNNQSAVSLGENFRPLLNKEVATGNEVLLNLRRAGMPLELKVRGASVRSPLPTLRLLNKDVAYLRLPIFDVSGEVANTVHNLLRTQKNLPAKLIIDVRDNPGGLATETVGAVGAFLEKSGFVLETRDGTTENVVEKGVMQLAGIRVNVVQQPFLYKGRIVVLVNQNSYSGAEYFAQLLQDQKRASVVGAVSGGLGNTATIPFALLDGSAIFITVSRSLRLSGGYLPASVTPDVLVADDLELQSSTGKDAVFEKALELLR
jgi:carboxyl-terminal processing protease